MDEQAQVKVKRLSHAEIDETLAILEVDWPDSMLIAGELFNVLSSSGDVRNYLVAARILEEGLRRYRDVTIGVAPKVCDICRMASFVNGVLDGACAHQDVLAMAQSGEPRGPEQSVSPAAPRPPGHLCSSRSERMDIGKFRQKLYESLVTKKTKEILKRFDYEAAVVDHRLDLDY